MKTICYISNFSQHMSENDIKELVDYVDTNNSKNDISGVLIVRNNHFFQILEGTNNAINALFNKIKYDLRHKDIMKLLDTEIDGRIFDDYNSGKFEIFQKYDDLKKLYLYFNWIKNANYMPADELIQLTTNFLKFNK